MAEARLRVAHTAGFHARPAALFVRMAAKYSSTIRLKNLSRDHAREADGKSLLGLLTLGIEEGHEILVRADGPDADDAISHLSHLVEHSLKDA